MSSKLIFPNNGAGFASKNRKLIEESFPVSIIDEKIFKECGLVHPTQDLTAIRVKCLKCVQGRNRVKSRIFKSPKQLISHLNSDAHDVDLLDYPSKYNCIQMVYRISLMLQLGVIGDTV